MRRVRLEQLRQDLEHVGHVLGNVRLQYFGKHGEETLLHRMHFRSASAPSKAHNGTERLKEELGETRVAYVARRQLQNLHQVRHEHIGRRRHSATHRKHNAHRTLHHVVVLSHLLWRVVTLHRSKQRLENRLGMRRHVRLGK